MPGLKYPAAGGLYRYGFNGKENDNEVKGNGNQLDYGARILDTRLGRFHSVDPLAKQFAYYSPYQSTGNNPIRFIDLDGQEPTSPPEFLKNIQLTHDLDKGNVVDGYFDPNDRLHYMSVEKLYDQNKQQAFFIHKDNQGNASYWVSQESTLRVHRKSDGSTEANGHWERYETYEQTQQKIRADAPDVILAFLGGGAAVAAAAPVIAPYAVAYGTQVATASIGSRFIAAGADASVQYAGNLMEYGWGKQNLNNINWSSSGLAFINPASIVTTGIGGNFLKYAKEDGFKKAIGGTEFNVKTATLSSMVDVGGGELGDFSSHQRLPKETLMEM